MTPATVTIIAGGWSAGSVDDPPMGLGYVVGVNDAFRHTHVDCIVSMDRLWTENRWEGIYAWAEMRTDPWVVLRRSAVKNIPQRPPWLTIFDNDHRDVRPSMQRGVLNGDNSGLCALNLALQIRPSRVVLIGFDMNRSPQGRAYWWPSYPWAKADGGTSAGRYREWAAEFAPIADAFKAADIDVVNTSMTSAIPNFRKARLESVS